MFEVIACYLVLWLIFNLLRRDPKGENNEQSSVADPTGKAG